MKNRHITRAVAGAAAAISLLAAVSVTDSVATAQPVRENAGTSSLHAAATKYKLLWQMEFAGRSGTKPSSRVFNYDIGGGGWGNNEHQAYTTYNASYSGFGKLNLNVNKVVYAPDDLAEPCPIDGNVCEYESARIQTKGKLAFKYGRIEAKIKVPAGDGTWPAFWLLGTDISNNAWPNCGEIDIMETKGSEPYTVHGTAHGPGYSGGDGIVDTKTISSRLAAGYHIYRIDWLPNSIKWYVDGKLYHTVTPSVVGSHPWVFNKPMFMILNVAMGGWFTGDIDPSIETARMSVDYIRHYSINGVGKVSGTSNALKAGKP